MKSSLLPCLLAGTLFLAARAADFTSTYVGGTRNWADSASWTTPGAPAGTFPNNTISPATTYDAVQNGGSLTLNQAIGIQKFTLTGGTLTASTQGVTLTLGDTFEWTGGSLNGNGGIVQANAGAILSGPANKTITGPGNTGTVGYTLRLGANSTWSGGNIRMDRTSNLVIQDGVTFDNTFNGIIESDGIGGPGTITNAGLFTKSAGSGTTSIANNIALNSSGTVNVNAGTLQLSGGGTHTGTFSGLTGTTLRFSGGTTNFNAGTFTTAGATELTGGTLNFAIPASTGAFSMTGGTLGGTATVTAIGRTTISAGTLTSSGGVLQADGGADFTGTGLKNLTSPSSGTLGHEIRLGADSTWTGGEIRLDRASKLTIQSGVTLTHDFDGSLTQTTGNASTLVNQGTFIKSATSASPTETFFGIGLTNSGQIIVNAGTLHFSGGSQRTHTSTGGLTSAAGTTIRFSNGSNSTFDAGSTYAVAGTTLIEGGTTTFNNNASTGGLSQTGGTISGTGTLTVTGPMTWTNGQMTGTGVTHANGGLTIAGPGALAVGRSMNLNSNTNWTGGAFTCNGTLTNKEGRTFTKSFSGNLGGDNGRFVNEGTFTDTGTGTTDFSCPITNSGTINLTGGTFTFNRGPSTFNGSGTVNVSAGCLLVLTNTSFTHNDGAVIAGSGTTRMTNTQTINGAVRVDSALELASTINVNGSGTLTVNGPTTWSNGAVALTGGGALNALGGMTFANVGDLRIENCTVNIGGNSQWTTGNIRMSGGQLINKAGGTFTTGIDANIFAFNGQGSVVNEGTFTKSAGTATPTNIQLPFTNGGTVNASGGTILFSSSYTQTAGTLVLNGGSVSRGAGTFSITGGKIQGGGGITGGVSATGGAVAIEPGIGTTTGTLSVSGDLTLTSDSKLSFDLGGTVAGTQHDQLAENGSTALNLANATLEVKLVGGFFPAFADTFAVVDSNQNLAASMLRRPDGTVIANAGRIATADNKGSFQVNYTADKVILSNFRSTITSLTLDDNQIVENAALGTVVGQLGAVDSNPAATFTFSLVAGTGDSGNGQFQIGGASGNELQAKAGLDFEAQNSYSIRLRVTNNTGATLEQTFTIEVQDVPNPSTLALSTDTIAENQPINTVIGALSATDPTPGATFAFELVSGAGDTDNGKFNVSGSSLRSSQVLDFEAAPGPFSIRARVTNNGGESLDQVLSITLINEGVTSLALSSAVVQENRPAGTAVGSLSASVVPEGTAVTYSLVSGTGSTGNAFFAVDGSTLKTAAPLDFEAASTRSVRVRATDANGETFERAFTITVTDVAAPTTLSLSANTIAENQPLNTFIGTFSATDPDPETTFTFALVSGAGSSSNHRFTLVGTSLSSNEIFDFEGNPGPFGIRVRVTNAGGESKEENFNINLVDQGVSGFALSPGSLLENSPAGTSAGSLSATVTPEGTAVTYALVENASFPDNSLFTIDADTVEVATGVVLDFEAGTTRSLRIRATDANGETRTQTIVVTLQDIPNPTDIALSASSIAENQPADTVVGTLSATDPDPEATFTFALAPGSGDTHNALFNVSGTALRSSEVLDFESLPPTLAVRLRVTSNRGETYDEPFTLTLTDQGPSSIVLTPAAVLEGKPLGTAVGSFSSIVEPEGSAVTYAFATGTGDTHNGEFVIVVGQLKTNAVFDHATTPTRSIRIRATGPGTETFEQALTITVNEAGPPTDIALSANTIPENQPPNTVVGTLSATDPDPEAVFTFSLVSGEGSTHNGLFNLLDNNLRASQSFDFDTNPGPFSIRLRVTNGANAFYEETFSITVTDQGPTALSLSPSSILEGRLAGTAVGDVSASTILPAGTTVSTWELVPGAADNALFTLDGTTVKTAAVLDHETASSHTVRVKATDANGESFTQDLTVTVQDVDITDITLSGTTVLENQPAGTLIANLGTVIALSDPEATPAFSLVSATPSDAVQVTGSQLLTTRPILRSVTSSIAVRLRAEHLGESFEKNVTITVNANAGSLRVENSPGTSITSLAFGDVVFGGNTTRTVTLRNPGPGHVFNVSIRNPAAPLIDYVATSAGLAADADLAPNESVTVDIVFTPQAFGNRNAAIVFESDNAPDRTINVTGRGIGPEISVQQPLGVELVDGAPLNFGGQPFGVNAAARTFVVKNVGLVTSLSGIAASITGPDAAFFELNTQGLETTRAVGASTSFRVTFQPEVSTVRSYSATLSVTSTDADENPFEIPLTGEGITPLLIAQTAYAKASDNGAVSSFGDDVAVSGNTVVVARSGNAYVFVRDPLSNSWSQEGPPLHTKRTAVWSVAISGDTIVLGNAGDSSGATGVNGDSSDTSAPFAGAAYVFQRSGGVWSQQAYLKASNTDAGDYFGYSVAISGDTVVVGALRESSAATGINGDGNSNSSPGAGAAYVFGRSGGVWSQQAYLKASNTDAFDQFGESVAIFDDTIVVGATYEDSTATGVNGNTSNNSAGAAGAAYVFQRSGSVWSQQAYLKASNTGTGALFGSSVSISGETIVVGARGERSATTGVNGDGSNQNAFSSGAAYVFQLSSGAWSQQAYLKASNTGQEDEFGRSVAISGDHIIVGAFREDSAETGINGDASNNDAEHAGAAYVFQRGGGLWLEQSYLKASNAENGDRFGESVAISGDLMVVGAPHEDSAATGINGDGGNNNATSSGAAYFFEIMDPQVIVHDGPDTGFPRLADNQAQAVDYGPTPLGIPVNRDYTINNVRAFPLAVSGITAPDGYVVLDAPTSIPAQGSAVFSVRLNALTLGTNSGNVTITTNDSTNPDFVFPVTGEVQALAVGSLDPRFGTGGVVKVDFAADDKAFDMLMLPDGRLVLAGERVDGAGSQFALARLLSNGALDTSFGGSGMLSMTVPGVSSPSITGICLQGDKIVAVGTRMMDNLWDSAPNVPSFALARYLADGSLDSNFGTAGFDVDTSLSEGDFTWNIVKHPSEKLLVAGMVSGTNQAYVRRFNQNGGRDAGFGTNGTVLLSNGTFGGALTVNAAGDAFAAGKTTSTPSARVWRINGTGGQTGGSFPQAAPVGYPTDTGAFAGESATAVALQPDGKPVVAISRSGVFDRNLGHGFITGRAAIGQLPDATYNGTGVKLEDIDPLVNREQANSIAVQKDGKLVAVGQVGGKWVVVRYTPTGELDAGFGTDGKVVLDLGASGSAYKVLLDAAGDIYVAGHASNGSNQDFVVVKLIGSVTHQSAIVVRNGSSVSSPVITSGQGTPISYGARQVSSPLSKVFLIENIGTLPLTIDSVTAPEHYRVGRRPTSVLPGASAFCEIVFKADSLGVFSGPVVITTNDPVHGTFTFPVTGEVVANAAPVYSPLTISTVEGKPVSVSLDKLVDQVTDANGDAIRIVRFDNFSEMGATITQADKSLVFSQPVPLAGTDTFKVRFSDGVAEVEGVVTVQVATDTTIPRNIPKVVPIAGGNVTLTFSGAADTTYSIQQSPDNVNFTPIGTAKTVRGKVVFTTTTPPPAGATFRIRQINTVAAP